MTEPAPAPPSVLAPDPLYRNVRDGLLADDVPAQPDDLTADDWRAERTDNGLRRDDALLPQPTQDPTWRPDDVA